MVEKKKFVSKEEEKPTREKAEKRIQIVRIAETDLNGALPVYSGIRWIRGVNFMLANAISNACPFSDKKIQDLSEGEIKQLEDIINFPDNYKIPSWLFNRRRDPESNKSHHLNTSQLQLIRTTDINKLKKMKSYKGVRHSIGLPVRGQRTRSTGRKGSSVGVKRKKEEAKSGGGAAK